MIFKKYHPNFCSGFDEYEISGSIEEILKDPRLSRVLEIPSFHRWSFSPDRPGYEYAGRLMAEYEDGYEWYVTGFLTEIPDLPVWESKYRGKK